MKKNVCFLLLFLCSFCCVALTSCDRAESPFYGAEKIPGPWSNNGYEIRESGWGEYEVYDVRANIYWTEYLDPFYNYESCVPDGCWAESYEPYFSTSKDELCWHVYCRGRFAEILIFKSGKYAPL